MANTPQAKKRIRRNTARTVVNKNRVSRIRTLVKKVENAVAAGDKDGAAAALSVPARFTAAKSEEHTSELQSLMRISYAVFCLKKKKNNILPRTNSSTPN